MLSSSARYIYVNRFIFAVAISNRFDWNLLLYLLPINMDSEQFTVVFFFDSSFESLIHSSEFFRYFFIWFLNGFKIFAFAPDTKGPNRVSVSLNVYYDNVQLHEYWIISPAMSSENRRKNNEENEKQNTNSFFCYIIMFGCCISC